MNVPEPRHQITFIDRSRIGLVCEEEWESFLAENSVTPTPEVQDLRGFLLNWVTVFLPEAFPSGLQPRMSAWLEQQFNLPDVGWAYSKPSLIGSTLFALTDDRYWLRIQLENFADGGSLVRSFFHKSLALVAHRISFDSDLVRRLDFGMKTAYFYMDVPLALYAVAQGEVAEKLRNLRSWQAYFMNPEEKTIVDGLLRGVPIRNPLLFWLVEKLAYVALRIGCLSNCPAQSPDLPLGIDLTAVWGRVKEHPLLTPYITLEGAK